MSGLDRKFMKEVLSIPISEWYVDDNKFSITHNGIKYASLKDSANEYKFYINYYQEISNKRVAKKIFKTLSKRYSKSIKE